MHKFDPKTTAVYMRVSTIDQTTESQRHDITEYLKMYGLTLNDVHVYEDTKTGTTMDRPDMRRLRRDTADGKITCVITQRLDRLSRRTMDGLALLCCWQELGIRVVSVRQNIDLDGPMGRMFATIFMAFAELEYEIRRERCTAGMQAAIARNNGVQPWINNRKSTAKTTPEKVAAVMLQGHTIQEAAKIMGINHTTVQKYWQWYREGKKPAWVDARSKRQWQYEKQRKSRKRRSIYAALLMDQLSGEHRVPVEPTPGDSGGSVDAVLRNHPDPDPDKYQG